MGLLIPDGWGQATLNMDYVVGPSNPMAVVIGYQNDAGQPAGTNAQFIRDGWIQFVMNNAHTGNNCQFLGVDVLQNPGNESGSSTTNSVGPNTNYCLPPNCALLVRKSTALGGRAHRGRLYFPGITTDAVSEGGHLVASALTSLQGAFSNFRTEMSSVGIDMALLHSAPGLAPDEVTSLEVQPLIATQRRRLR